MRLRELTYPIAVVLPNIGMSGGDGGSYGKATRFRWNLAPFYINGNFDDAVIYDCDGRRFEVDKIELRKPAWWRYLLNRLGYLIILPDPDAKHMVDVDMILRQTAQLTLEDFKTELTEILLDNPAWWKGRFSRHVISTFFRDDTDIKGAINRIGIIDKEKWKAPGKSAKVVDLR